ncbi:MAG TPA: copper resistance CopC family protein [Pseudolysinimonas sp.]|nr:copper resistance CopC family protein [Pseudolysinimonas sp.]
MARRPGAVLLLTATLVAIGAVGLVSLTAAPANAHNVVVETTPAAGETLTELPAEFSIVTNEPLLSLEGGNGFVLRIRDSAGLYYGDGCVRIVDATMSATPALGAPGDYTVLWQSVSADGHTIDGEIPFTWAGDGDAEGVASPPVCGATAPEPTTTNPATPGPGPGAEAPTASEIDLATVLWVGGALLAVAVAVAVAIVLAGRRRP